MALLTQDGKYIRILPDGKNYEIYSSKEKRDKAKNAPSFEEVLAKYNELCETKLPSEEALYYLTEEQLQEQFPNYKEWEDECQRYVYNNHIQKANQFYPLMAEYIPNVSDSIVDTIQRGSIKALPKDIVESYTQAKNDKYFGNTENI